MTRQQLTSSDSIAMQSLNGTSEQPRSDVRDGQPAVQRRWSIGRALTDLGQPLARQSIAFFLFGLLNNSLYVVILTAALELIPKGTPTGLVAFFNIFPALVAKAIWPYLLRGEVRYTKRIWSCVLMNFVGLLIIALLPSLFTRLAGIGLASFSSGLGELSFLQLSTRFSRAGAGRGVAWFASGTGAAGLVGASAWWIVRPLGVTSGLLSLSFLPVLMGISYAVVLPSIDAVNEAEGESNVAYEPLAHEAYDAPRGSSEEENEDHTQDDDEDEQSGTTRSSKHARKPPLLSSSASASAMDSNGSFKSKSELRVVLTLQDKMQLIKPMLFVYILPLVLVYFFEYTINQGVAPTLLYPIPKNGHHPLLALAIKQLKDYYPFYQLTYQTFVFLSRSSISIFRLPAIPKHLLWVPAFLQGLLLVVLTTESLYNWFRDSIASPLTIVMICIEGLAGGSAYVSVFYQIGTDDERGSNDDNVGAHVSDVDEQQQRDVRRAQEHEFRIGCVGVGDTMGILLASLVAIPLELSLCASQVARGRTLCKEV
jgi:battenin